MKKNLSNLTIVLGAGLLVIGRAGYSGGGRTGWEGDEALL